MHFALAENGWIVGEGELNSAGRGGDSGGDDPSDDAEDVDERWFEVRGGG